MPERRLLLPTFTDIASQMRCGHRITCPGILDGMSSSWSRTILCFVFSSEIFQNCLTVSKPEYAGEHTLQTRLRCINNMLTCSYSNLSKYNFNHESCFNLRLTNVYKHVLFILQKIWATAALLGLSRPSPRTSASGPASAFTWSAAGLPHSG
jgi:hypothetical protein